MFGEQGVEYLQLLYVSLVTTFDCVCSLRAVDWPAVNLFEIAVTSSRATDTPMLL